MIDAEYAPGAWWALIADDGVVLLPPDAEDGLLSRLWDEVTAAPSFGAVVDALSSYAGGVFSSLPPFAAVIREGRDLRVAVRGNVTVAVDADGAAHTVSGTQVTTWSERLIVGGDTADLRVDDAETANRFPIRGGIVAASRVWFGDGAASEASAGLDDEQPEIAATAVPEPEDVPEPEAQEEPEALEAQAEPGDVAEAPVADEAPNLEESSPEDVEHTVVSAATLAPGDHAAAVVDRPGDHDGATISLAQLRAVQGDGASAPEDVPTEALPEVVGGRIRMSTGQEFSLDRAIIIGRRPRSTRSSGDTLPQLVAVESPQQDISRNHLEIRPEAGSCVAIDLHTTNGSTLLRAGAEPMRLHPGEHTVVVSGDVIDLGDGVTVAFEDLP